MIKTLFSKLFKRRKSQSPELTNTKPLVRKAPKDLSEVEILLRKAAELKDTEITKAIEIVKQVIELTPHNNQEYYFKLANYLYLSGSIDGAYKIYDDLMAELDENKMSDFNMNKSIIYERICMLNYKTGKYQDYMACYFYWLYNYVVGLAFQGKVKELNKILNVKNKLSLLAPAKVEGCFKKLNQENVKGSYNGLLLGYFSNLNEDLILICKKVEKFTSKKPKSKRSEYVSAMNEDNELIELFKKYNCASEMNFYPELNNMLEQ